MKAILTSLLFLCACGSELTIVDDRPLPEDDAVMFPGSSTEAMCRKRLLGTSGPLGGRVVLPAVILGPPVTGTLAQPLIAYRDPDGVPDTIGVHILPLIVASGSNIRHRAFGTIRWGHEGANFTANFDLLKGVSFAVYGSAVDISVTNESEGVVVDANGLAAIPVAGLLQPGCSPSDVSRLRRSFGQSVDAAGTAFTPPAFATELDVQTTGDIATNVTFRNDGNVIIASYALLAGTGLTRRPIPIPNDAKDVVIDNPAGNTRTEVIFYLSL